MYNKQQKQSLELIGDIILKQLNKIISNKLNLLCSANMFIKKKFFIAASQH
jgi:hypothetical protein